MRVRAGWEEETTFLVLLLIVVVRLLLIQALRSRSKRKLMGITENVGGESLLGTRALAATGKKETAETAAEGIWLTQTLRFLLCSFMVHNAFLLKAEINLESRTFLCGYFRALN